MKRSVILILSIMVLCTSSCAMKKILWDYIGAENTIPTKALSSAQEEEFSTFLAAPGQCTAKNGDLYEDADFVITSTVSPLFILFFVVFLLPWMLFPALHHKEEYHYSSNIPIPLTVPIYLKLGRLVYYS